MVMSGTRRRACRHCADCGQETDCTYSRHDLHRSHASSEWEGKGGKEEKGRNTAFTTSLSAEQGLPKVCAHWPELTGGVPFFFFFVHSLLVCDLDRS